MPHIHLRTGPRAGERIEILGEVTVGRENADVVIADEEISRRHAVLRADGEALTIEDAGSLNGTYVDGRRIDAPTELADGAELKMGTTVGHVELRDAQATRLTASPPEGADRPPDATVVGAVPPQAEPATAVGAAAVRGERATAAPARDRGEPAPATATTPPAPRPAVPAAPFVASVHGNRKRGVATRSIPAAVFVSAVVVADAVALIIYFGGR
jgi:hypothetical protein